ncbi:MAG TPA: cytochrome c biogenesis protein CcsA [Pyrinomonadaceae bacterium]|nr:cytochrome c biogenesis protein CcsA [Pyrinomonadaceae bacterium]
MSEVLNNATGLNRASGAAEPAGGGWTLRSYLPALLPIVGAILVMLLRIQVGGDRFIADGALMMLALACYLAAATFHLTNLYAPSDLAQRLGLWLGSLGVFFNLSSWLVRWIEAHDRELKLLLQSGYGPDQMPWFFRYIPFANLYDLSLAFAFGAGLTTMLIAGRKSFRFLGALSLPLAALILVLARFIGNEFIDLPPVLDSYWRPIHVGIASLSYGVALVCFATAIIYLLKDGVKSESMAIWTSLFALAVIATIGGRLGTFPILTSGTYSASTFLQGSRMSLPLRADIPYVGPLLILAGLLLIGVIVFFLRYVFQHDEKSRRIGHLLLKLALVAQACAVVTLVAGVKGMKNVVSHLNPAQYERFGEWLAEKQGMTPEQVHALSPAQMIGATQEFIAQRGSSLILSLNANPVELAALITAFTGTLFVIFFSFRTERLREALPAADKLDGLMYKTASVTFAGLAMLLITGAIWANESWGRYWGWDAKETGAFVAWLTYGAFLHARIARGMRGRSASYFAIVAFLFILFTYLGVSYLLPGLHSYA